MPFFEKPVADGNLYFKPKNLVIIFKLSNMI